MVTRSNLSGMNLTSNAFLLVGEEADTHWTLTLRKALAPLGDLHVVPEEGAVQAVLEGRYRIIVVDAGAVEDVATLTFWLRSSQPEAHVVVATASPTWRRAREALQVGASDYVRKSRNEQALYASIKPLLEASPPPWPPSQESAATILFADNDPDFLETRAAFLAQLGYRVVTAHDPAEARRLLAGGGIDLLVVDLRLHDDEDEKDISGLDLVREVAGSVPKILLTAFPSVDTVREALGSQIEGLAPAIDFVAKREGPGRLLQAVRYAIGPGRPDDMR